MLHLGIGYRHQTISFLSLSLCLSLSLNLSLICCLSLSHCASLYLSRTRTHTHTQHTQSLVLLPRCGQSTSLRCYCNISSHFKSATHEKTFLKKGGVRLVFWVMVKGYIWMDVAVLVNEHLWAFVYSWLTLFWGLRLQALEREKEWGSVTERERKKRDAYQFKNGIWYFEATSSARQSHKENKTKAHYV